MNKIYTVIVTTDLTYDGNTKRHEFGSSRLVGWYSELEEGLHNPANKRWWFKYNRENTNICKLMSRIL